MTNRRERFRRGKLVQKGYEGDVKTDAMMLLRDWSNTDQTGAGKGHDGDIEMKYVSPAPLRVAEPNHDHNGLGKRDLQAMTGQGASKKRTRCRDDMDVDEEEADGGRKTKRTRSDGWSTDLS